MHLLDELTKNKLQFLHTVPMPVTPRAATEFLVLSTQPAGLLLLFTGEDTHQSSLALKLPTCRFFPLLISPYLASFRFSVTRADAQLLIPHMC